MPNVENIIGLIEKLESQDIAVHQDRCVRVRNRNAGCRRCADACTSGCLSYEDNKLVVAPERCIGCGTCATVCPTCAIEAKRPNDAALLSQALRAERAAGGTAIIACRQILDAAEGLYDPAKTVRVECLGRVDESLIAALAEAGCQEVVLVKGLCAECDHAVGLQTAELVRDTANTLMETWGCPLRARIADRFPAKARKAPSAGYDESRRRFFTEAGNEARDAAAVTAGYALDETLRRQGAQPADSAGYLKVGRDGTLPHFLPDRRERLLDSLAALGQPADELIETRLWGHVIIDKDKCASCRMCATFCPTGAISKFDDADGSIGIEHAPSECVKCRCCEDICPEGALSISDEVFAVDLMQGVVERCYMDPVPHPHGAPDSILWSLKGLLACDQVYER